MALLQVHPPLDRGHSQEGGEGDKDGEPSPEGTWAFREPGEAGRQPSVRGEGRRPAPSGEGRRPTSGEGREEGGEERAISPSFEKVKTIRLVCFLKCKILI